MIISVSLVNTGSENQSKPQLLVTGEGVGVTNNPEILEMAGNPLHCMTVRVYA